MQKQLASESYTHFEGHSLADVAQYSAAVSAANREE